MCHKCPDIFRLSGFPSLWWSSAKVGGERGSRRHFHTTLTHPFLLNQRRKFFFRFFVSDASYPLLFSSLCSHRCQYSSALSRLLIPSSFTSSQVEENHTANPGRGLEKYGGANFRLLEKEMEGDSRCCRRRPSPTHLLHPRSQWWLSSSFRERITMDLFPNMTDIGLRLEGRRTDHFQHTEVVQEGRHHQDQDLPPNEDVSHSGLSSSSSNINNDNNATKSQGHTTPLPPSFSMSSTDAVKRLWVLLEEATEYAPSSLCHPTSRAFPCHAGKRTSSSSSSSANRLLSRWKGGVYRGLLEQLFLDVYFLPGVPCLSLRRRLRTQSSIVVCPNGVSLSALPPRLRSSLQSCVTVILQSTAYSMNLALEFLVRKGEPLLGLECFMIWWYCNPDQVPVELPFKNRFLPFSVCRYGSAGDVEVRERNTENRRQEKEGEDAEEIKVHKESPEGCLYHYLHHLVGTSRSSSGRAPSESPSTVSRSVFGFLCPKAIFPSTYREGLRRHLLGDNSAGGGVAAAVVSAKNHITSSLLLRVLEVAFSLFWEAEEINGKRIKCEEGNRVVAVEEQGSYRSRGGRSSPTSAGTSTCATSPLKSVHHRMEMERERAGEIIHFLVHEWILPLFSFTSSSCSSTSITMRTFKKTSVCPSIHTLIAQRSEGKQVRRDSEGKECGGEEEEVGVEMERKEEGWWSLCRDHCPPHSHHAVEPSLHVEHPFHWLFSTSCIAASAFLQCHHKTLQSIWRESASFSSSPSPLLHQLQHRFLSSMLCLLPSFSCIAQGGGRPIQGPSGAVEEHGAEGMRGGFSPEYDPAWRTREERRGAEKSTVISTVRKEGERGRCETHGLQDPPSSCMGGSDDGGGGGGRMADDHRDCIQDAFYCTLHSFADGGAYHRVHPASSAYLCECWFSHLLADFPEVFRAERCVTTLWVFYMLENIAASRPGGTVPLSFFGQEGTIEEWVLQCGAWSSASSSYLVSPVDPLDSLLGADRYRWQKSSRSWPTFFADVLPSSPSFFGSSSNSGIPVLPGPEKEKNLPKEGGVGGREPLNGGKIKSGKEEHRNNANRETGGRERVLDRQDFVWPSPVNAPVPSSTRFIPCTVTSLTMRWSHELGQKVVVVGGRQGESGANNPSASHSCARNGTILGADLSDSPLKTFMKDGETPVEVLSGARDAAIRIFLRFLALSFSEEGVPIPSSAQQPSGYVLLRLLHLLCFMGYEGSKKVEESTTPMIGENPSPSGGDDRVDSHPSLRPALHPVSNPLDAATHQGTADQVRVLTRPPSDPLIECLSQDVVPCAHVGLLGYLRRLQVLYLSHSGRYGTVALLSPPHRSLLDAFSVGRTWQVLSTTLLWSGLPANSATRALLRDGITLSDKSSSAYLLAGPGNHHMESLRMNNNHSNGSEGEGGQDGSLPLPLSPCWGRGSLAWEALTSCFEQWTWLTDYYSHYGDGGPLNKHSGSESSNTNMCKNTSFRDAIRRRPPHHLPILREVLTHLLMLATAIPDEAPQLLSLSCLHEVAVSSAIPSLSSLLPLFHLYLRCFSFPSASLTSRPPLPQQREGPEEGNERTSSEMELMRTKGKARKKKEGKEEVAYKRVEESSACTSLEANAGMREEGYCNEMRRSALEEEDDVEGRSIKDEMEEEDWVSYVEMEEEEMAKHAEEKQEDEQEEKSSSGVAADAMKKDKEERDRDKQIPGEEEKKNTVGRRRGGGLPATTVPREVSVQDSSGEMDVDKYENTLMGVREAVSMAPFSFRQLFLSLLDVVGWWMGDMGRDEPFHRMAQEGETSSACSCSNRDHIHVASCSIHDGGSADDALSLPSISFSSLGADSVSPRTEAYSARLWKREDKAYHTLLRYWTAAIRQHYHIPSPFLCRSSGEDWAPSALPCNDKDDHQKTGRRGEKGNGEEEPLLSTAIVSSVLQVILSTCPDTVLVSTGVMLLACRQWERKRTLFSQPPSSSSSFSYGEESKDAVLASGQQRSRNNGLSPPFSSSSSGHHALLPWYLECGLCRFFYHVGINERLVHQRWWRPMVGEEGMRKIVSFCLEKESDGKVESGNDVLTFLQQLREEEDGVMKTLFSPSFSSSFSEEEEVEMKKGKDTGGETDEKERVRTPDGDGNKKSMEEKKMAPSAVNEDLKDVHEGCQKEEEEWKESGKEGKQWAGAGGGGGRNTKWAFPLTFKEEVAIASLPSLDVLLLCASVTLQSLYGRFLCEEGLPAPSPSPAIGLGQTHHCPSMTHDLPHVDTRRKHIPFYVGQFAPSLLHHQRRTDHSTKRTPRSHTIRRRQAAGKRTIHEGGEKFLAFDKDGEGSPPTSSPTSMIFPSLQLYARHPSKMRHEVRPLNHWARFPEHSPSATSSMTVEGTKGSQSGPGEEYQNPLWRPSFSVRNASTGKNNFQSLMAMRDGIVSPAEGGGEEGNSFSTLKTIREERNEGTE